MNNAKEYYNSHSVGYVEKWDLSPDGLQKPANYYRLEIIKTLIRLGNVQSGDRIVEIGCGTGLVLQELVKTIKPIYGTDISIAMLERTKDSLLKNKKVLIVTDFQNPNGLPPGGDVYLMQNDFLHLRLPKNYFNKILSMEVIRYIDDLPTCFKNVREIMNDETIFVFTATNFWSLSLFPLKYTIRKLFNKINKEKELLQHFVTEGSMKKTLRDAGFSIVAFEKMNVLSFNPLVERMVKTADQAKGIERWNKRLTKVPIVNKLFDTFVIAVKISK